MDAALVVAIASIIESAVKLGPIVIKGVEDAKPFAEAIVEAILGGPTTPEKLDALEAKIAALSAQLQADLPPE